ncbi:MAG TPA: hypothetical protein VF590_26010, partial [Isosphaeraceae bacterium]
GLDGLAGVLDPDALGRLGSGLGETADFLDRAVVPAAARAADDLEAASARLQAGAHQLGELARRAPPDLGPVRAVHEALGRFDQGLTAMDTMLEPRRLAPLRQAAAGTEGVAAEAARLADRLAGYTYPVVALDGLRPRVSTRPFWPRGAAVGADLKRVAGGVAAMDRELGTLAAELPQVQTAIGESRRALAATRQTLAAALQNQGEAERLLKDLPEQAAQLEEALPRLTADLAAALRATGRLAEVAAALRRAQAGIDGAVAHWPEVRTALTDSAVVLRASRDQLDEALEHRREYEAAVRQLDALSGELAAALPGLADHLETRLTEEDRILAEMDRGIAQVDGVLPAYSQALVRCLGLGRLLAFLVAGVAAWHGSALVLEGRGRRLSSPGHAGEGGG